MLYYQQGFHLAYFKKPLFNSDIEAWKYGPVVPEAYGYYENNGRNGIELEPDRNLDFDSEEEYRLFLKVFEIYGKYSASGLINMTHNEDPWLNTPTGLGNVITHKELEKFFLTRLKP